MAGLRFEAWTLPWSATFERVIADIPVKAGQGSVKLNDFAGGQITVPADYVRLTDIISDTVGSLIRVYDGTTIIHEFLAQRVDFTLSESSTATIAGSDVASMFDRAVIYPFDYPTQPSTFSNFVWGGPNVLDNAGFELQENRSQIVEVDVGAASGGTFTLSIGADPTGTIAYNASDTTVQNAIETGIAEITDVLVAGSGSTADPWRIEFVVPPVPTVTMSGDGTNLTPSDTLTVTTVQIGNAEISQAWTKSQRSDSRSTPALHGDPYTIFRQSSGAEPVKTGSFAHVVQAAQYGGLQQIVQCEPGGTYQASMWVRSSAASQTFRLVIRDRYEGYIDSVEVTPSVDTYTEASIADVVIPAGVTEIVFRMANVTPPGSIAGIWYFDDASFNEGLAAANVGVIVTALMGDAISDHTGDTRGAMLDWVQTTSWDATNDSSTTAWADTESFTAFRGASYGQTFDRLVAINYEWRLVPLGSPSSVTHDLEWYATGNLGTVYTAADRPAINIGQGITKGTIVKRIPNLTAVLVEGAEGAYYEQKNSTTETNYGRYEAYRGDTGLNSTTSLTALAQHMLDQEAAVRTSITVTVIGTDDHPRPLVDYTVGDTLNVQLPPIIAKTGKRVSQITYQHKDTVKYQVTLVEPPA